MPTMNFIEGEIAADNGAAAFVGQGIRTSIEGALPDDLAGRKVVLGIRSEHVEPGRGDNPGKVRLIEPLGDATLVFFEFGGKSRLVAKVDPDLAFKPGDNLTFALDATNRHLFAAQDGARLN